MARASAAGLHGGGVDEGRKVALSMMGRKVAQAVMRRHMMWGRRRRGLLRDGVTGEA